LQVCTLCKAQGVPLQSIKYVAVGPLAAYDRYVFRHTDPCQTNDLLLVAAIAYSYTTSHTHAHVPPIAFVAREQLKVVAAGFSDKGPSGDDIPQTADQVDILAELALNAVQVGEGRGGQLEAWQCQDHAEVIGG
jgi:hypothetical protein